MIVYWHAAIEKKMWLLKFNLNGHLWLVATGLNSTIRDLSSKQPLYLLPFLYGKGIEKEGFKAPSISDIL